MNWTGGHLSRHFRNANGSLDRRQKQRSAKASRNHFNGPHKRSSIEWSIFDKDQGAAREEDLKLYATTHPAPQSQRCFGPKNDGRLKVRPQSETSLNPAVSQAIFPGDKTSSLGREHYKGLLTNGESNRNVQKEALSPSNAETGKQKALALGILDDVNTEDGAGSLEERRRRILRRIDWVGANFQHPMKLRLTGTGNNERLAKRRRITACHQNRFGAIAQPIITSPFTMPRPKQKLHGSLDAQSANGKINEVLPRNHVRISVGGRHVAAGIASSTTNSKSVGGRFVSSRASTSDGMLLDGDDISRKLLRERQIGLSYPASPPLAPLTVVGNASALSATPRNLPVHTPHRKRVLSSYSRSNEAIDQHTTTSRVDLNWRSPTPRTGGDNFTLDVAQHLDERFNHLGHLRDQKVGYATKHHSNLATLRSHGVRNCTDTISRMNADVTQLPDQGTNSEPFSPDAHHISGDSRQLSENARKLQSVARDKLRRNARLDSRPELLHPIPLTSRTSRVLCSPSSEAGSNVAQVHVEPIATPSQKLDEEIWKTWALSPQRDISNESYNVTSPDVSISPGISNCGYRYVQEYSICSAARDINNIEKSQRDDSPCYASNQEFEQAKVQSSTEIEKSDFSEEILPSLQESVCQEDFPPTRPAVDYKSLFISRARKPPSSQTLQPVRMTNPDEAWMKFILSDNDSDEEVVLQQLIPHHALHSAPIQYRPSSSMVAHFSAKTTSSSQPGPTISSVTGPNTTSLDGDFHPSILSADGRHTSNHTTQGSNHPPSDEQSQRPSSVDQIRTFPTSSSSTPSRPIRKLIVTKPPRFRGSSLSSSPETTVATAGSPVHIGKGFSVSKLRDGGGPARRARQQEKDIYRLERDGVESIDDD